LSDPDRHSLLLQAGPEEDFIHARLLSLVSFGHPVHLQVEGLVLELIDRLLIRENDPLAAPLSHRHQKLYLPAIDRIKEYMQGSFTEPLTTEQLASIANMSPFHFNRIFKQVTRITPYQYLLHFRLNNAMQLLKETSEPVAAIAYRSGFNSPDHFSFAFRAHTGYSPKAYREQQ
jgi:AraC family transcriptional regulator